MDVKQKTFIGHEWRKFYDQRQFSDTTNDAKKNENQMFENTVWKDLASWAYCLLKISKGNAKKKTSQIEKRKNIKP